MEDRWICPSVSVPNGLCVAMKLLCVFKWKFTLNKSLLLCLNSLKSCRDHKHSSGKSTEKFVLFSHKFKSTKTNFPRRNKEVNNYLFGYLFSSAFSLKWLVFGIPSDQSGVYQDLLYRCMQTHFSSMCFGDVAHVLCFCLSHLCGSY